MHVHSIMFIYLYRKTLSLSAMILLTTSQFIHKVMMQVAFPDYEHLTVRQSKIILSERMCLYYIKMIGKNW